MRVIQMELGIGQWFFRQNPTKYMYLTDVSKIVYMWIELKKYNINIHMDEEWTVPKQYSNDVNIMDTVVSIPTF